MTNEYKEKLEVGLEYQDFVIYQLYRRGIPLVCYGSKKHQWKYGETFGGFEIKYDRRFRETGNFYIETAEKSDKHNLNFIKSGIYRDDNTWIWCIGDYETLFFLSKRHLITMHKKKQRQEVETSTSKGFLLPVELVESFYALKTIQVKTNRS